MPFPGEIGGGIALRGIVREAFGHECADRDCREKANANHALADGGHQLGRQLIGDLVEPERIESAFARGGRIGGGEERK